MAQTDWIPGGIGNHNIILDAGSNVCQFAGKAFLMYSGSSNLTDSEIVSDLRTASLSWACTASLWLRADIVGNNGYRFARGGSNACYIQKIVNSVITTISYITATSNLTEYRKMRFRINGYQLSIEEYVDSVWTTLGLCTDSSEAHASGRAGIGGESLNTSYFAYHDNIQIGEK